MATATLSDVLDATTAPSHPLPRWADTDWAHAYREVQRLQQRIFRATQEGQWRTVRNLQKLLLRSSSTFLLAVRQVTQVNDGRNTPGIDGKLADTAEKRDKLVHHLCQTRATGAKPVKRVFIPKANGKLRPLGIPTIEDRVRQCVVKMALEPSWEARFEPTSYGFRPGRCTHDAITALFMRLRSTAKGRWILDADIQGAFDHISHTFILDRLGNFPRRSWIKRWLTAGYLEQGQFFATTAGTPQGGIISPLLANIALDGLDILLKQSRPSRPAHVGYFGYARYADDFVVVSPEKESLEQVLPSINQWLAERGLELNDAKTRIVHIDEGFNFLGFHLRHYNQKLLIKPQKDKVLAKLRVIAAWLRHHPTLTQVAVIRHLNNVLRGWALYYHHVVSKQVFAYVDARIFRMLWSWIRRRHPNKTATWRKARYFRRIGHRRWVFATETTEKRNRQRLLSLVSVSRTPIIRHVMVKGSNSPMDPTLQDYWLKRNVTRGWIVQAKDPVLRAVGQQQNWRCPVCRQPLFNEEPIDTHHLQRIADGGSNATENLQLRHEACHYNAHKNRRETVPARSV